MSDATVAPSSAAADAEDDAPKQASPEVVRLAGRMLTASRAMASLEELVDEHPARMTGTKGLDDAAAWAAATFKSAGIASARIEPFTMAHGWERRDAHAAIVSPAPRTLHVTAAGWFPPIPAGGIRAEIVRPPTLTVDAVKKTAASLEGKIVLLDDANKPKGWASALDALRDAGAVALVNGLWLPDQATFAHSAWYYRDLVGPLPMVDLGEEDAKLLRRALVRGPVTIEVTSTSPVTAAVQVPNVLAEIRGREHPEEWVLLGAHLDAWDFGAGAQDDGTGVAEVLEAARAIAGLGVAPRRSIRFALFGGEEQGALGSRAYADAHAHELDRAALVIVSDGGAGAPKGFRTGRDDLEGALAKMDLPLKGLGGGALSSTFECGTDDCPFALLGVPAIAFECDATKYPDIHHRASDTLDKVVPENVVRAAAILAITAWMAADAPFPIAPRATRADIGERLKKAGLLDSLVFQGRWKADAKP